MGFWDSIKSTAVEHGKAQFLDVIEWTDDSRDTIVYRFPVFNNAIQDGGKLVVREGQAAVFVNEGTLSDVFGPGTYELSTRTKAIASFFESIKYALNYPYKGDIYFVNTRQFTDQKWGTPNPIMMHDKEIGPVRVRAFGNYTYKVTDPATFLREIVGTSGLFTTAEINGQLKRKLVSGFADTLGEAEIPVLRLAASYMDLGDALRERISKWFESSYGISLTDFVVENVSLPPEVEKMLDKRSSMGLLGDMNKYTQFQAAEAIGKMAERPGGGSSPFMDAGMGLAMGNVVGGAVAGGFTAPGAMGGGAAPPPPPGGARLHYNGPGGQAQLTAQEVAQRVAQDRSGDHHVWMPGWPGWKPWSQVPEIANLVPPPAAAPPPLPGAASTLHYSGGSGGQEELSVAEVAKRVAADPGGRHLVWKAGMSGWTPAKDVPEVAQALAAAAPPPPPPPVVAPPPPPMPDE